MIVIIVIVVSVLVVAVVSDGAGVFSIPWCSQCGVIVSETVVIFFLVVVVVCFRLV